MKPAPIRPNFKVFFFIDVTSPAVYSGLKADLTSRAIAFR